MRTSKTPIQKLNLEEAQRLLQHAASLVFQANEPLLTSKIQALRRELRSEVVSGLVR